MNKQTVYIPSVRCKVTNNIIELPNGSVLVGENRYVFTPEELKQLLEDYTNRIVNEIGLVKTTSEELNAKDYQPFITDGDEQVWTINKEHILSQLPKFLKEKGI